VAAELFSPKSDIYKIKEEAIKSDIPVIGITGTGGAGKSSLIDELVRRFINSNPDKTIAIVSVDPSRRKTGGALLGDRIRMNAINHKNVYMRSLATRGANLAVSPYVQDALDILKMANYDFIILETSGIGQSQTEIVEHSDLAVYVMTPEFGAPSQLEKIDMLDFADIVVINKFDKFGAKDAIKDVKKQVQRNHESFDKSPDEMPVYGTTASQFNDDGVNAFFVELLKNTNNLNKRQFNIPDYSDIAKHEITYIVPPARRRYLSEIAETIRDYNTQTEEKRKKGQLLFSLDNTISLFKNKEPEIADKIQKEFDAIWDTFDIETRNIVKNWEQIKDKYVKDEFVYKVRNKEIKIRTKVETLSNSKLPKISVPKYDDWGEIIKWNLQENFPGFFPFTAGVFPFKREGEDPTRMFAGEGGPERTNKRFHYVSHGMPAKRLSTAFDSVTLYGEDPAKRPDIYGKIGNSGVSISSLDDAKRLYSGFKLTDSKTSVSMTINGPAPIMTAFFLNAAIDQECEIFIKENGLEEQSKQKIADFYSSKGLKQPKYRADSIPSGHNGLGLALLGISGDKLIPADEYKKIKNRVLNTVRGTIQADILKEDQAQNTCIYSIDFSLKLMGDMQKYFIDNAVRNFYSVSISGYHIAEAGANPITQLALTLSNGFTYVEYYLARGMNIDDFAPNLSFFFSNGLDPEYSVIGRVARRIWAKAIKLKYKGNERSQKLKYHIQTSGRSLHSQEIEFNDIRTSLQAVYAIYDNCNSLHTNAYDEAITTPTEESVRRALAIQLIINNEYGLSKNQNPLQGSFIIEELTDIVEEAVLMEFDRITARGGVLGAMETMYQRNKIQEESMFYEHKKMSGELPIIGVNTFISKDGSPIQTPKEVIRASEEEKQAQLNSLDEFHEVWKDEAEKALEKLKQIAESHGNVFEALMETAKYCSLGQISNSLYNVGGQYRRNM